MSGAHARRPGHDACRARLHVPPPGEESGGSPAVDRRAGADPLAVEETLRYYTIIFGDGRKVTRDIEFHGVPLKKGTWCTASCPPPTATRVWERGEFVIDRKKNNHFGFASGPHRCLGLHLAGVR